MLEKLVPGILWWKPKQWERAKKMSSDSHVFDDTYQNWKEGAEKALKNFHDLGIKVYKIEIEQDKLIKWCKDQKIPFDSKLVQNLFLRRFKNIMSHNQNSSNIRWAVM